MVGVKPAFVVVVVVHISIAYQGPCQGGSYTHVCRSCGSTRLHSLSETLSWWELNPRLS